MLNKLRNDPWLRGYQAFFDAEGRDANPYNAGSPDRMDWIDGYGAAVDKARAVELRDTEVMEDD